MKMEVQPTHCCETIALGDIPAHIEKSCISYCDLEAKNRCKSGVVIEPGLAPTSFRDSIIVYINCTRKKYVSRVEYAVKMKPKSYYETSYLRPKTICQSFVSVLDYKGDGKRKWYKTTVQLKPKVFTSEKENIMPNKSKTVSNSVSDQTLDSIGYGSGDESFDEQLSPLRLEEGQFSPLSNHNDNQSSPTTKSAITCTSYVRKSDKELEYQRFKSRDSGYGAVDNFEDETAMQRSGPFVYNAPKSRKRTYNEQLEDDTFESKGLYDTNKINGNLCNGDLDNGNHLPQINGYGYSYNQLDDLIDL